MTEKTNGAEESRPEDIEVTEDQRVRAWILVSAVDPDVFSASLGHKDEESEDKGTTDERDFEFGPGGNALVVVRADVVDVVELEDVNMEGGLKGSYVVVPVDAQTKQDLVNFAKRIDAYEGAIVVSVLLVKANGHHPYPPHRSSTYVTWRELITDPVVDYFPAGRHPQSPGRNPWG